MPIESLSEKWTNKKKYQQIIKSDNRFFILYIEVGWTKKKKRIDDEQKANIDLRLKALTSSFPSAFLHYIETTTVR